MKTIYYIIIIFIILLIIFLGYYFNSKVCYKNEQFINISDDYELNINLEEFTARIGNDILFEDLGQILTEDGEVNENDINAIMLEDDTYLTFEENDSLVLEDNHWNHKFLNIESARHRIEYVANSTFMKFTNETHDFTNLPFRVNHLEQVPA